MSKKMIRLMLFFSLAGIAGCGYYLWHAGKVSTDDAFVERDVIFLTPRVSGTLVEVLVSDNQKVAAGDLLARIDPKPYEAELQSASARVAMQQAAMVKAQADLDAFTARLDARKQDALAQVDVAKAEKQHHESNLARLDAQIAQAQRDVDRYERLAGRKQVSEQALEDAKTNLATLRAERETVKASIDVASSKVAAAHSQQKTVASDERNIEVLKAAIGQSEAALKQAQADEERASLALQWTEIRASSNGWISRVDKHPGSFVSPQTNFAIEVTGAAWVKANFKETQIGDVRIGDKVSVEVDAYPGVTFSAKVESFQPGTGSRFSLLPPENASGNYVKVVQRVPVKIIFDEVPDGVQLWPGMSVIPTVYVSGS
ncbi:MULTISPECIES: HlyD family secretion protein [unclassified Hahella]|uniref:HlyD family secretion protein n=1 Tax=unclassified Hahella TaxID=2624107 RepID=UPI001C1E9183|nr:MULTISPECIES: HlyD family secretion protein [unclassified Hahella]MBU6950095.1 HlyD family secretion protein [Hahella sp. HN01]MDG9671163.1 HlyD family secretion protein [Hahella sp. CR1]